MYYADKLDSLQRIFGTSDIQLRSQELRVGQNFYPIINDVIITIRPNQYTDYVSKSLPSPLLQNGSASPFASDIQFTFGEEWNQFNKILPEHYAEFARYFDLINLSEYRQKTVCDLGCGNGRWSFYLADHCQEIVLVDFSDAIFTARANLRGKDNCLFIMADIKQLPFQNNFVDFLFSIGVLHHLPTPCLAEARALEKFAPELLVYLYYALDNRPWYFRVLLRVITPIRLALSRVRNETVRRAVVFAGTYALYRPLVWLGKLVEWSGGEGKSIPLYEGYHDKSAERIKQDVYDRFFTRLEQRVSKAEIEQLRDTFSTVRISPQEPYWHFICQR